MLVATDFLGICSRRYSTFYIHVVVSSRDISHILWVVFTSMTIKILIQRFPNKYVVRLKMLE